MNNQELLNSLSLKEASVRISDELIKAKHDLEATRRRLIEDKKTYEADYVRAYEDGDVRENEPLKAATQNLKLVTGEMALNADVMQRMDGLEDSRFLVGTYDFNNIVQSVDAASTNVRDYVLNSLSCRNSGQLERVLLESSTTEVGNVVVSLTDVIQESGSLDQDIECLRSLNDYWEVKRKPEYNTCGIIVLYTTVRLRLNGQLMTYKIYPNGVSFIDIGVMAANSRVARALLGKEKGQSISIRHDSNNTVLTYEIVDIY